MRHSKSGRSTSALGHKRTSRSIDTAERREGRESRSLDAPECQSAEQQSRNVDYLGVRYLTRGQVNRILKLIVAGVAGPHVANTMLRYMLRPLRGDYIGAALRTLIEWEHFLRSPFNGKKVTGTALPEPTASRRSGRRLRRNRQCHGPSPRRPGDNTNSAKREIIPDIREAEGAS